MSPALRDDFPLLRRTIEGRPIIYLDSAATSLKPACVMSAEQSYATQFTANVHRGKHALSEEASAAFEGARRRVARFFGADPACVVFVRNTTEAINLVASGLRLSQEDVVVNVGGEHHSNLVPWMRRARLVAWEGDPTRPASIDAVQSLLEQHEPRVLAIGYASHVTGVIQPVKVLCEIARARGILTLVDAAQAAAHLPIDLEQIGCDFLAMSAHKALGPTGIGMLYGRREALESLDPLLVGGGMVDRVTATSFSYKGIPHRFEAGTPPIGAALGFAAAVDYLDEVGFDAIIAHERRLSAALSTALSDIPGLRVLLAAEEPRIAIASVAPTSSSVSPDHLARMLSDSHAIMVRSGYHCAHPLFDRLDLPHGALRASASLYNTIDEIHCFGEVLRDLVLRMVI